MRALGRALGALLAALVLSAPSPSAAQGQITFTSATAFWHDATDTVPGTQPGDPVISNGVPTSSVSWGTTSGPQSGYDVTITIPDPQTFPVATFSHRNFPVNEPWLTSVQLDIVIDFDVDGEQTGPLTFTFTFTHEETPNNQTPCPYPTPPGEGCTDRVTFIDAPDPTTFTVGGKTYTVALSFLDDAGDPVDEFITREGGTVNTANLDGDFVLVPPVLEVTKSGPTTMNVGPPGTFVIDVQNTGPNDAWNTTLLDVLPDDATGGMCDATPQVLGAQVFADDGVTPAPGKGPLVAGTDFTVSYAGAPTCELTLTMLSAGSAVRTDERLIVTYQTELDTDSQNGAMLMNVAGATEWFAGDPTDPDRAAFARTLTDGTVGTVDHEDAHTVDVLLPELLFEKTVTNLTTSQTPALVASPGDVLRYQLLVQNLSGGALDDFGVVDDLGSLNPGIVFEPGSLSIFDAPSTAVTTGTDPDAGTNQAGLLDVQGLSLAGVNDSLVIVFDVRLAAVIPDGTLVTNQSQIVVDGSPVLPSDDPGVNGPALPDVAGDEDPTEVPIVSGPTLVIQKTSTDLTGDPNVLLAGETLRYDITIANVGSGDATQATLRDLIPVNTSYVPGSTLRNGSPVPDGAGGVSPLAAGLAVNAPSSASGVIPADPLSDPSNGVTLRFEVVVDPGVIDGTIISNQGFVTSLPEGIVDDPSDDPGTLAPDDPTRDVVGDLPLLFAAKSAVLLDDMDVIGEVNPNDTLLYTITVDNIGSMPALDVLLQDAVPANASYVPGTTQQNGELVPDGAGGTSPLIAGFAISSNDLTPPIPGPGEGEISPGASAEVTFVLRVDGTATPGTIISNQAVVTSEQIANLPTDGDGNPATGPEPTIVVVGNAQQLSISKQVAVVGGGPVLAGSTLEYVVLVENVASVPASTVVITDDLDVPVGMQLTYVDDSATLNGAIGGVAAVGSVITANYSSEYGPLAPGETALLRFQAVVDPGLAMGTPVTNTAVVTWNAATQMESASVTVDVGGTPGAGALAGALWHDADFDDAQGLGERALEGWTVELYRNGQLVQTMLSDAGGAYAFTGLPPNDVSGDQYVLRFGAPGSGTRTAALGVADSPFTNTLQQISDILLGSGSNPQGLNLPIDPNGVVFGALSRAPVAGATVSLLDAGNGTALPLDCFDDPVQQGQITGSEGWYKFSVNFSLGACPLDGDYLIAVAPPGAGFASGASQIIPPSSDATTSSFSVPSCPGTASDAIPATLAYCEAQDSELAPSSSIAPGSAGTTYYLRLTLNDAQLPGSSQIFNNHIALDPEAGSSVAITKTTPKVNVARGDLVPYRITVHNTLATPLAGMGIVDTFPAGFHYVKGSARVDGVKSEPLVDGRVLSWNDLGIAGASTRNVDLLLAVGAGVSEGEYTNQAQAVDTPTGIPVSGLALATVRVIPDPTFSCTDVIGKVFDDRNRNGIQDPGEKGLAGAQVVTPRGLKARTDAHGRYHITCAAVPREDRGSNLVLKLDDRTLPSGFRTTTPAVQVKRATQGKALRFNFGASLHRVVGLDLVDAVFEPGTAEMRPQWTPRVELLLEELQKAPSILRLSYVADLEEPALVEERVDAMKERITRAWKERAGETLTIETEIFWRREPAGRGPLGGLFDSSAVDALPPVGAGPPVVESEAGAAAERHLPIDEPFTRWSSDPERLDTKLGDRLEERDVLAERPETVKLRNVIPPIHFASGHADIPVSYVERLRGILESMQHLNDVRIHLVGHADDQPLSPALAATYVNNEGLSRERAGEVAVHLMDALGLPPESIAFTWAGASNPIASNATEAGRAQNRRVEVEVWYDEIREESTVEEVVVPQEIKRVKICRTETVCKLRYREGHGHRARLRNLIPPLRFDEATLAVPSGFIAEIREALQNLGDRQNVTVKVIAFTDDLPLTGRTEQIYGTHLALSKAWARRVAQDVQDALGLPNAALSSDGRGASRPVASNDTAQGRALNRRIEVEFWHDDPLQALPDDPQPCPDAADAELVTQVYDPPWGRIEPLAVENGRVRIPEGYTEPLSRALSEVENERNPRLRFIGYTSNERLDRRTAMVYGDDIGLSTDRARRAMEEVRADLGLSEEQAEHEGHGFVHSNDVVNAGFIQGETDHVQVQVVYDELALLDDYEGVAVTPITRELEPKDPLALNLMRITVDGEPIDDPGRSLADVQRCTDVALERADVRFRFDDLESSPRLSVTAERGAVPVAPASAADAAPSLVLFRMYTNYPHFIERAEVRIFDRKASPRSEPLAIAPVDAEGIARWEAAPGRFAAPLRELSFVLRAYDPEGRFDETAPQTLWEIYGAPIRAAAPHTAVPEGASGLVSSTAGSPDGDAESSAGEPAPQADPASASSESDPEAPESADDGLPPVDPAAQRALLAGYGESDPATRNIPLDNAGTVRVDGSDIPPGHTVWVAGAPVPVDENGNFVAETMLPNGMHTVEVAVLDEEGNGELFLRDLEFEKSDWFYMGIADVTVSGGTTSGPDGQLEGKDSRYDRNSHVDGRLAFYVDGKFGEDWRLTASADTREEPVEDLFTNFTDKTPDSLLRRIDPDYFYPTFGDDGTVEETAPTLGKFYVKLSKDESYAMWGNFKASYLDNELAQVDRGLYGGNVHYQTNATTSFGDQRLVVDGFAADPGTVSGRDEFEGTGGSLYFLQRQDILVGSERARIEIRDKDSGLVTGVVPLRYGLDYDIDYFQGRIVLTEPLSAVADDDLLVRSGGLSGNLTYLVVRYEYTPGVDEIDTLIAGGQAQAWLTDYLAVGATASRSEEDHVETSLYGAQVTLRATDQSWIKLQGGRSEGPVSASVLSEDGGFTFRPDGGQGVPESNDAFAYRADASLGVGDLIDGVDGRLHLYYQRLDEDYSAPGQTAYTDTDQAGGFFEMPVTEWLRITAKADWTNQNDALETQTQELDVEYDVTEHWSLGVGVRNDMRDDHAAVQAVTQQTGDLTDGVVQLGYDSLDRWRAYAFGQGTLRATGDRDDNHRGGVGGAFRISDRLSLGGEVSHGSQGLGAQVGTTFQQSERTTLYLTYALENERALGGGSARTGNLVSGARMRFSDSGSVFVENRYQHASTAGLTQAVGMDFAVTRWLSLGATWENGELRDRQTQAETKRRAGSATVGYRLGDIYATSGVEYRYDDIENPDGTSSNRTTWLFRNDLKLQLSPDWRLLSKYHTALSDSSLGSFFDGGYTEGVVGFAYRPVANDRLNVLSKYTYFYDVPTTDQLSPNGSPAEYVQRSHIASVDATYDLFPGLLTIGAKYAFRRGEVSLEREDKDFFDNNAHLGILRADLRFLRNWEVSGEGRILYLPDIDERRSGALLTVYRYLGDHFKVGIGYNFTDFSDDLTDLSYDHQGWFFNIVGTL